MSYLCSDTTLETLPMPLVRAIRQFDVDYDKKMYFRSIHRLIDIIEVYCKLYTVAGVSQCVQVVFANSDQRNWTTTDIERMDTLRMMLGSGLKTPSLGIWWGFARESAQILSTFDIPHVLKDANRALTHKKSSIKKSFDSQNNLISFRNGYAHGATPSDEVCKNDILKLIPRIQKLLTDSVALIDSQLLVSDDKGKLWLANGDKLTPVDISIGNPQVNRCYFFNPTENSCVDLFPLLTFQSTTVGHDSFEKNIFFFYNDLRGAAVSSLNYPYAQHIQEKKLKEHFLNIFPIDEWKKLGGIKLEPFRERIESLTEVFKGRKEELALLAEKLRNLRRGFFVVWGAPGVGKSTLLARMIQMLRWSPDLRQQSDSQIEWPDLSIDVIEFFIRRGSTDTAVQFLDSMNQRLDTRYRLRISSGESEIEKRNFFYERLNMVSKILTEKQRLVLVIDGLDEARHNDILLDCLPREVPNNIIVIYGSRPQQFLRYGFYDQIDRERRSCIDLGGLSLQDTRALLCESVNKYQLESHYTELVLQQSEGNPLYLKLLCQGLEEGVYQMNNTRLPTNMAEIYQNLLVQIQKTSPLAIDLLTLLAAAKDFISPTMMADFMEMSVGRLKNGVLSNVMELLYKNPMVQNHDSFQLFHESLREYLKQNYLPDIRSWECKLAKWGQNWCDANGETHLKDDRLLYAMKHTALHIADCRNTALQNNQKTKADDWGTALIDLVDAEPWRTQCFLSCGNGVYLQYAIQSAQIVLRHRDVEGSHREQLFRYAKWLYDEPFRLYNVQRERLRQPESSHQEPNFEDAVRLARMGNGPTDKIILLCTAMWVPSQRYRKMPTALIKEVEMWLEEVQDLALNKLWNLSKGRQA